MKAGDEQAAFDAIEEEARVWTDRGYEPADSEPGEWLVLRHPDTGHEVTVTPDGTEAQR